MLQGRVLRFACVGVASTLLYCVGAIAMTSGTPPLFGAAQGSFLTYCACAVFSYAGHKLFTFRSGGAHRSEAPRFLALTCLGLAVSFCLPALLTGGFGLPAAVPVLVTTVAIPLINYAVMNFWVFAAARGEHIR